jgi:hypothetical protein
MKRIALAFALAAGGCTSRTEQEPSSGDYLHVWAWARDTTRGSLLATFDLGQTPPSLASVVFAEAPSRGAHHIEHDVGVDSMIFANAFGSGRTFIFDLRTPGQPRLKASLADAGPFSHPHSYVRLPNGNRLATFQWKAGGGLPGGLVELDTAGTAVRWSSAAPQSADSLHIVPYSLTVLPELDRVVSTSTHMIEDIGIHVQVWRLSDLSLLHTIPVPRASPSHEHAGHDSTHHRLPGEPRVLADGRTVMFGTFTCGLYHVTDLAQNPKVVFSAAFPGSDCAVPVVVGKYWIQTVPAVNALVALDVSNPAKPIETSRLIFSPEVHPHWLGVDPTGRRLAVSSADKNDPVIRLVHFDPETGMLSSSADAVVLSLKDVAWPDGFRGDVVPHGIVFGRR